MEEKLAWVRTLVFGGVATLGTAITWLLGGWDQALMLMVVLMTIDYVTGVVHAACDGCLNSTKGWRGLLKKAGYFVVVIVAVAFDRITGLQVPLARTFVIAVLSLNECLSLLEHAGGLGVPIPPALIARIEKLRRLTEGAFGEGSEGKEQRAA